MELRSLKFAVTLAEELHFGRAAERHFVSAQPFGRTIAALEREIGTPLFNRTTRRVELTPAGDKFVSRAEQVLVDVEELVTSVRSAADVESDHLVLGVFGVGLGERGPDVMATFQRAWCCASPPSAAVSCSTCAARSCSCRPRQRSERDATRRR